MSYVRWLSTCSKNLPCSTLRFANHTLHQDFAHFKNHQPSNNLQIYLSYYCIYLYDSSLHGCQHCFLTAVAGIHHLLWARQPPPCCMVLHPIAQLQAAAVVEASHTVSKQQSMIPFIPSSIDCFDPILGQNWVQARVKT